MSEVQMLAMAECHNINPSLIMSPREPDIVILVAIATHSAIPICNTNSSSVGNVKVQY